MKTKPNKLISEYSLAPHSFKTLCFLLMLTHLTHHPLSAIYPLIASIPSLELILQGYTFLVSKPNKNILYLFLYRLIHLYLFNIQTILLHNNSLDFQCAIYSSLATFSETLVLNLGFSVLVFFTCHQ